MSTPLRESRRTVQSVQIPVGARTLAGDLAVPAGVRGLVIFAHGSGSNRISPRNRHIADVLDRGDPATLFVDLLTSRLVAFCSWA
jgi:putative phosphoribosyl transferase